MLILRDGAMLILRDEMETQQILEQNVLKYFNIYIVSNIKQNKCSC